MATDSAKSISLLEDTMLASPRAAKIIGVAEQTLRKWRLEGVGPRFVRIGRAVRYRLSDLEAFVAAGTH